MSSPAEREPGGFLEAEKRAAREHCRHAEQTDE